ncbi:unnamed protein product [Protopolystoma xenopodis]|uniref:Uncharacterized protein n=1 Tax=Protopolystoma xenopodis TaxID=117903 RepID=A0A3S5FF21_9PLAT|nr:unnamed protein product [Protopolystoma xenopodis]
MPLFGLNVFYQSLLVQGGTQDEAIVEINFRITFRVIDPELAIGRSIKGPDCLLRLDAQTCLLTALTRLRWAHLETGAANLDLAEDTRVHLCTLSILFWQQSRS